MRYGYEPDEQLSPAALWDDLRWRRADEAQRLALRHQVVCDVDQPAGQGGGLLGAFLVAGAMLVGVAVGQKKRR